MNKLIGTNFVTVDFDQDGIIDRINRGEITVGHAQLIYDNCLKLGNKENKLQIRVPIDNPYLQMIDGFEYEIKKIKFLVVKVLNEFKTSDTYPVLTKVSILVDQNTVGLLDKIVKGDYDLSKV